MRSKIVLFIGYELSELENNSSNYSKTDMKVFYKARQTLPLRLRRDIDDAVLPFQILN